MNKSFENKVLKLYFEDEVPIDKIVDMLVDNNGLDCEYVQKSSVGDYYNCRKNVMTGVTTRGSARCKYNKCDIYKAFMAKKSEELKSQIIEIIEKEENLKRKHPAYFAVKDLYKEIAKLREEVERLHDGLNDFRYSVNSLKGSINYSGKHIQKTLYYIYCALSGGKKIDEIEIPTEDKGDDK